MSTITWGQVQTKVYNGMTYDFICGESQPVQTIEANSLAIQNMQLIQRATADHGHPDRRI